MNIHYTANFILDYVVPQTTTAIQFKKDIMRLKSYKDREFELVNNGCGYEASNTAKLINEGNIDITWGDFEKELKEFSKDYLHTIFRVEVLSEDEILEETRIFFFHKGSSYYEFIKIIYPEFNIDKLK